MTQKEMTNRITAARPTAEAAPCPSPDLRAAYQAHTLVQMLYGQLAVGPGWPTVPYPYLGPPAGFPPSPILGTTPWTADERYGVAWPTPLRWQ